MIQRLYAWRSWLWLVPAIPAAVLTALILVVLPADQSLDNLAEWAFRLAPLVLAVLTIAVFPRRFGPALLVLAVLGYMAYVDTALVQRILRYGAARSAGDTSAFLPVYQFQLIVVSYVILFGLLAFRMGGARSALVLKVGGAAVLIVVSGLNDLTFWLTNTWPDGRPSTLDWASHIAVFVGGPPTVATTVVFMLVHLALAAAVLTMPLGRWIDRALSAR
jgi:hypothetical protein